MTKAQIKAELRRSAMEDRSPVNGVAGEGFFAVLSWKFGEKSIWRTNPEQLRWFYLLVAEAM